MPNDSMTTQEGVEAAAATETAGTNSTARVSPGDPGAPQEPGAGSPLGGGVKDGGNPFDFSTVDDGEPQVAADDPGAQQGVDGDYAPDFGDNFNESDEVRAMVTGKAREAGIDAKAAGSFVSAICDAFRAKAEEQAEADYKALQDEWGANFDRNMDKTRRFMGGMLKRGEISEADARELMTPAAFRFTQAVMARLGEGRAVGTGAKETDKARRAELDDIMNNPGNPHFKVLANPRDPNYQASVQYVNSLAGFNLY